MRVIVTRVVGIGGVMHEPGAEVEVDKATFLSLQRCNQVKAGDEESLALVGRITPPRVEKPQSDATAGNPAPVSSEDKIAAAKAADKAKKKEIAKQKAAAKAADKAKANKEKK